jgi:hypothetical protein
MFLVLILKGVAALFVILGAVIAYFLYLHVVRTTKREGEAEIFPGPLPFLGFAIELGRDPIGVFKECAEKTVDVFGVLLGGRRMFLINDPHSSDLIFTNHPSLTIGEFQNSIKQNFFNVSSAVLEAVHNTKGYNEGASRKLIGQTLLNEKSLNILTRRMTKKFTSLYNSLITKRLTYANSVTNSSNNENTPVEIRLYDLISRFVFNVTLATIMNEEINDNDEKCSKLYEAFREFDGCMFKCLSGYPIKYQSKPLQALLTLQNAISIVKKENFSELIEKRFEIVQEVVKQHPELLKDYFSVNAISLIWASVSNSMPATFWILYYVIQQPSLLQEIQKEIKEKIPNYQQFLEKNFVLNPSILTEAEGILPQEQLNSLHLIDACFTEALRLTSGSLALRTVKEDNTILEFASGNKYKFRKGDRIGVIPTLFHFNEKLYPNPNEFNPYRFIQGDTFDEKVKASHGRIHAEYDGKPLNS